MKHKIFVAPQSKHLKSAYGHLHLDDCLGAPCPTGYLAAGYLEMNRDLESVCRGSDAAHEAHAIAVAKLNRTIDTLKKCLRNKDKS